VIDWATAHPICFTILTLPVVVTGCLVTLFAFVSFFGLDMRWRR
jgi:hypothetical protein